MPRWIRGWRTTDRIAAPGVARRVAIRTVTLAVLAVVLAAPAAAQKVNTKALAKQVDASGKLLYGRNADRLFIPASNTKLVVAATAAALLPPDFTVRTSLYASGPVVDSAIQGDLVLYGRGDPTFGKRCYATDTTLAG